VNLKTSQPHLMAFATWMGGEVTKNRNYAALFTAIKDLMTPLYIKDWPICVLMEKMMEGLSVFQAAIK